LRISRREENQRFDQKNSEFVWYSINLHYKKTKEEVRDDEDEAKTYDKEKVTEAEIESKNKRKEKECHNIRSSIETCQQK
jgi:hypothetical protein